MSTPKTKTNTTGWGEYASKPKKVVTPQQVEVMLAEIAELKADLAELRHDLMISKIANRPPVMG